MTSDFDDNVGHWQVMKHPTKAGWTRVLYSTNVKLFPWIPNIIVNFITSKALVESTTWVKKESEAEALKQKKGVFPQYDDDFYCVIPCSGILVCITLL